MTVKSLAAPSAEGTKALQTMITLIWRMELDAALGRYLPKHGAFMEAQALRNAIAYCPAVPADQSGTLRARSNRKSD